MDKQKICMGCWDFPNFGMCTWGKACLLMTLRPSQYHYNIICMVVWAPPWVSLRHSWENGGQKLTQRRWRGGTKDDPKDDVRMMKWEWGNQINPHKKTKCKNLEGCYPPSSTVSGAYVKFALLNIKPLATLSLYWVSRLNSSLWEDRAKEPHHPPPGDTVRSCPAEMSRLSAAFPSIPGLNQGSLSSAHAHPQKPILWVKTNSRHPAPASRCED